MSNLVAIHQPNFLPWEGFFDKLIKSDTFIILDDVQFPKSGGWINRSMFMINNQPKWITIPVSRNYTGLKKINEISINSSTNWREQVMNKIDENYRNHDYFRESQSFLESNLNNSEGNLANLNFALIQGFADELNLKIGKIILSSTISHVGSGTERLCSLIKQVDGTDYYCGGGSSNYLDPSIFQRERLNIKYQNFLQKPYAQLKAISFTPGLSIVDMLMNLGRENVKERLLNS
jgi:hypothetical protein